MMATIPTLKPPHITHLVGLNEELDPIVVMCLKVKPRHLDPDRDNKWSTEVPSCAVCYRKYHELKPYPEVTP